MLEQFLNFHLRSSFYLGFHTCHGTTRMAVPWPSSSVLQNGKKRLDIHPIHDAVSDQQVFSHFPTHFCWRSRPSESQPDSQTAPCVRRWSHLAAHPRWPNNHRHPATSDFVHIASPLESHENTSLQNKKQWRNFDCVLGLKSAWNGPKWWTLWCFAMNGLMHEHRWLFPGPRRRASLVLLRKAWQILRGETSGGTWNTF